MGGWWTALTQISWCWDFSKHLHHHDGTLGEGACHGKSVTKCHGSGLGLGTVFVRNLPAFENCQFWSGRSVTIVVVGDTLYIRIYIYIYIYIYI